MERVGTHIQRVARMQMIIVNECMDQIVADILRATTARGRESINAKAHINFIYSIDAIN